MNKLESANKLSRRTTPTWEVELLISGGAVFAMLQLPGLLDQAFFWMEPRLAGDWRQLTLLLYVYSKGAAVILAGTFVLHVLLRARWIALVGVNSVYPEGIRWEKITLTPIQREIELEMDKPFPDLIERADNLATTVFAIGVMLALFIGTVAVAATSIFVVSVLLEFVSAGRVKSQIWLFALMTALLAPFFVASILDNWRGAQWGRDSLPRRAVRWLLLAYSRIGFGRSHNPVMTLISRYSGDRKALLVTFGLMTVALLSGVFAVLTLKNSNKIGSYSMFPWPYSTIASIDSAHYDDQRDPLLDGTAPYIPTMVAHAAYLKLVLPYKPRFDEPAMRERCGKTDALEDEVRAKALLGCLATLHSVSLDGDILENLAYDVAADPRTDRPALLAMIDVRALPKGRHELRILRAPSATTEVTKKSSRAEREAQEYTIPFWR